MLENNDKLCSRQVSKSSSRKWPSFAGTAAEPEAYNMKDCKDCHLEHGLIQGQNLAMTVLLCSKLLDSEALLNPIPRPLNAGEHTFYQELGFRTRFQNSVSD